MAAALINHPYFGSLWLEDAYPNGDRVVGQVEADWMAGHRIMETMNFPLTCVRKWDR